MVSALTNLLPLQLMTVAGVVTVRAPYGYSTHAHRWLCPAREHWGSRISDDAIHALVQRGGARAQVPPPPPPVKEPSEPDFSLVIMMDGWMVRQRGPQWGAPPESPTPVRVAWHEVKSAVIYRLEHRAENQSGRGLLIEKKVVACAPQTQPLEFGAAVQNEAMRCGLARAQEVLVVVDGAVWIWGIIQDRFATATKTLDFYHGSQHLWELAHHLHPGDPEAARQWIEPLLHSLRHDPQHGVAMQSVPGSIKAPRPVLEPLRVAPFFGAGCRGQKSRLHSPLELRVQRNGDAPGINRAM